MPIVSLVYGANWFEDIQSGAVRRLLHPGASENNIKGKIIIAQD